MSKNKRFELWYKEAREICEECYGFYIEEVEKKVWREYFEYNYSPAAAVAEEFYFE